jgi:hypothetical protein
MASISALVRGIKDDPAALIDPDVVEQACRDARHRWRDRMLDPVRTLEVFAAQVAHGNTAIAHAIRLVGGEFSESAYCQARARLPLTVMRAVLDGFTSRARAEQKKGPWCGHRAVLIDGSGISTPDTPDLRRTFGTAGGIGEGCGLPLMRILTVFDAHDGLLLDVHTAPAVTHDLRHVDELHPALKAGDVLVGDRGFCAFVHLAMLKAAGCHGVFRISVKRAMPFPAKSGERTRRAYNRHRRQEPILVDLVDENDQVVEIVKPRNRPKYMTPEAFAKIPSKLVARAVRYSVRGKGLRTREITLLTTLTDSKKYPAAALSELYLMRWRIEINLRHLKRTMGMDRLKCRSVDGVKRELLMFALIYNAVCRVRAAAAHAANLTPIRLSFVDALRAMLTNRPSNSSADIKLWPLRPPRLLPRQLKRRHSEFRVMTWPRACLTNWIAKRQEDVN